MLFYTYETCERRKEIILELSEVKIHVKFTKIVLLVKTVRINLASIIPRKRMVRTYMISRENSNREKSFWMHVISSCMLTGARKRIKDEWKSFSSCLCKKPPVMAPIYYSRIWNSEEMSPKMFNFSSERIEGIRISHSFWSLFYEFART